MNDKKGTIIADTIHGSICLSPLEKKVISHVTVNRMHDIYQNSTVYLTFPCNRTKRFEHSVGTMNLCSDIFRCSISNTDPETLKLFFKKCKQHLFDLLKHVKNVKYKDYDVKLGGRVRKLKIDLLPLIADSEWFCTLVPTNAVDFQQEYIIMLQSVRIAALLHDVGHPPYSHVVESALKDVYSQVKNVIENKRIEEFNLIMGGFFSNNKKLHEQMGNDIVDIILSDVISNISQQESVDDNIYDEQIFGILVKEVALAILSDSPFFTDIHRIIDGTLDGDRLDYVTRDSINSGLNSGKIEYDRLISSMCVVQKELGLGYMFISNIKVLSTVEDFLSRRWAVYKNIVFHHRVIKTDYLLQRAVTSLSLQYLRAEIALGQEDEDEDALLPSDISGLWKALKKSTNTDRSYALSQWDDSWLITILKKHYFKEYIDTKQTDESWLLSQQLSELLNNQKHYFSTVKRLEDFLIVDKAIALGICSAAPRLRLLIEKLKEISSRREQMPTDTVSKEMQLPMDPFLNLIATVLERASNEGYTISSGLLFAFLKRNYDVLYGGGTSAFDLITEAVEKSKCDNFKDGEVADVIVSLKKYDIGTSNPLFLYNKGSKCSESILKVSSISQILSLSYDTFPQFHIYVLKNISSTDKVIDVRTFLENVGTEIANKFVSYWENFIDMNIKAFNEKEGLLCVK